MLCFVDESGELSNYTQTGSTYFLCTAVLMYDYEPIKDLYELRHALEHEGFPLPAGFHAMVDARPMRRRVFNLLSGQPIFVHTIALRKSQIYPNLRPDEAFVYRIACRMLFSSLFANFLADIDEHSIVFSTFSSGKVARRLKSFQEHIMHEFGSVHSKRVAFWEAPSHAGLQIADYCSWIAQRSLENPTDPQAIEFSQLMNARVVTLFTPFG